MSFCSRPRDASSAYLPKMCASTREISEDLNKFEMVRDCATLCDYLADLNLIGIVRGAAAVVHSVEDLAQCTAEIAA